MSEYQLEIKQIVDYPRCRIYRQFVQSLIADCFLGYEAVEAFASEQIE